MLGILYRPNAELLPGLYRKHGWSLPVSAASGVAVFRLTIWETGSGNGNRHRKDAPVIH